MTSALQPQVLGEQDESDWGLLLTEELDTPAFLQPVEWSGSSRKRKLQGSRSEGCLLHLAKLSDDEGEAKRIVESDHYPLYF